MRKQEQHPWFIISVLCCLTGVISATIIFLLTIRFQQPQIKEIHQSPSQHFEFPGEVDLDLKRKGVYAIYYVNNNNPFFADEWPVTMHCQLLNLKSGELIALVPDYVRSNRICSHTGECTGKLVFSTTVNTPGMHRFSCKYEEDDAGPKIILVIGPNYIFEFLLVIWRIRWSILAIMSILCLFSSISVICFVIGLTR